MKDRLKNYICKTKAEIAFGERLQATTADLVLQARATAARADAGRDRRRPAPREPTAAEAAKQAARTGLHSICLRCHILVAALIDGRLCARRSPDAPGRRGADRAQRARFVEPESEKAHEEEQGKGLPFGH